MRNLIKTAETHLRAIVQVSWVVTNIKAPLKTKAIWIFDFSFSRGRALRAMYVQQRISCIIQHTVCTSLLLHQLVILFICSCFLMCIFTSIPSVLQKKKSVFHVFHVLTCDAQNTPGWFRMSEGTSLYFYLVENSWTCKIDIKLSTAGRVLTFGSRNTHRCNSSPLYAPPSLSSLPRPSSYHSLRARALSREEVPEIGRLALLLWHLPHPDAAAATFSGATQAVAAPCAAATAATQTEAQGRAQRDPAVLGVGVLIVESGGGRGGGGLGQAEQVVVGVEVTHVVDGFPRMCLTWRKKNQSGVK